MLSVFSVPASGRPPRRLARAVVCTTALALGAALSPALASASARPATTGSDPTAYFLSAAGTMSEVDTTTGALKSTVRVVDPLGIYGGPSLTVPTPDGKQVYVVGGGNRSASIVDAASDKVISAVHFKGVVHQLVFAPGSNQGYGLVQKRSISVINTLTHKVTTLAGATSPIAEAVSPDGTRLYVTQISSLLVYDTATDALVATDHAGPNPDQVVVSSDGTRAYVATDQGAKVVVIDTGTGATLATIPTGHTQPVDLTMSPDGSQIYVTNGNGAATTGAVPVISTATDTVTASIPACSAGGPVQVTFSPTAPSAYIQCSSTGGTALVDTASETVTKTIPAGVMVGPLTISSDGSQVYTLGNTLTSTAVSVFDAITGNLITTVPVGKVPLAMTLADAGARLYVANSGDGTVTVVKTATDTVAATIASADDFPDALALSPDGTHAYVGESFGDTVLDVDTATGKILANIPVGGPPTGLAVTPDGSRVYVANGDIGTVSVIDTATDKTTATVTMPLVSGYPAQLSDVAISADGSKVYLADGSIFVIDTSTNTLDSAITTADAIGQVLVPAGGTVAYGLSFDGTLAEIDTATDTVTGTITTADPLESAALSPDGTQIYAEDRTPTSAQIQVIDAATGTVTATVAAPDAWGPAAITPDGSQVYFLKYNTTTVTVFDTATDTLAGPITLPKYARSLAIG